MNWKLITEIVFLLLVLAGGFLWGHGLNVDATETACNQYIADHYINCYKPHCSRVVYNTDRNITPMLPFNLTI